MQIKLLLTLLLIFCAIITCGTASAVNLEQNYTDDDDFDSGSLVNLEHNSTSNQLQLVNGSQSAFPYIWVPNSNQGTVSKVSTTTGLESARYRTAPATSASAASPSRTTIDLDGGCWVGNRGTGTVVKIGLLENGGFFDRNHNGIIETSRDLDGNGVIDGAELLDWGADECVLWEVLVIQGLEGTYRPGEYTGSYSGTPGPRGIAVDRDNNVWIGTYGTHRFYYVNGNTGEILRNIDVSSTGHSSYGAVIDQYGILWSSGSTGNNILRLDPSNNTFTRINIGHNSYGLGLDRNNHLFVTGWTNSCFSRINILTGVIEWRKSAPYQSRGVVVTDDGDVWIANSAAGTVTRYSNDGEFKATIIVGNTPTGVSVDNQGKIWVVDNDDEYIHRINPNHNEIDSNGYIINGVELSKRIIGGTHYGYSDMTGTVSSTITTNRGTWTVIHDSGMDNTPWGLISWTGYEPENTSIQVRVRSSNDQQNWSDWKDAINNTSLDSILTGRYLQVETTLQRLQGTLSPILYDLKVTALVADVQLNMTVDKPSPQVGENVTFTLNAANQGPLDVTGLTINVTIPPGFTVNNTSHGNYHNGVWNIGNLPKGGIATLTISGLVNSAMAHRTIVCAAEKSHQDQYDPNTPDTASASFYLPLADLEVTSNFNKPTINVGDTAVFTTIIQNNGPDPSRNLIVEIPLPTGFNSLLPSLGIYENGIWAIPLLNAGSTAKITLIGEVTQNMAHNTITEIIEITQREYDPTPNSIINNSFYVPLVDLEIKKTAHHDPVPVGGVALFTISVKNTGPDTARGVVIKDAVPDDFIPGIPSKGIIRNSWWLIDNLDPGESATLLIGNLVDEEGKLTNDATITSRQYDPNSINNQYLLTVQTKNRIIIRPPVFYPPVPYDPSSDDPNNPSNPNTPDADVINPATVNAAEENNQTIPMQDTGLPMNLPSLALILIFFGAYVNRNGTPRSKPLLVFLILLAALLSCGAAGAADGSGNYTTDADFDNGTLKGVEHKSTRDQLQLPPSSEEPEFIWVPNGNEGTVSKVNTQTGAEVARYRTGPNSNINTFTAAVDKKGNCWVANARAGSLVKIGLYEKGVYQDRNNNGIIDTSRDLDHNGVITGTELLAWGADECVLFENILIPGNEGTYIPGTYTGAYVNYDYGIRSLSIDSDTNLWAGNYNSRIYYYINTDGQILRTINLAGVNHNPYTSVIDQNGILWSGGNNLLRLDPSTGSMTITNLGYLITSLALDSDVHLFSYGYTTGWNRSSKLSRINTATGGLDWTQTLSLSNAGCVTLTPDGDVWVSEYRTYFGGRIDLVKRYSHDGELKATINPGYGPNGLSVDSDGKVWVVDWDDEYIHRIDPAINGVDLSKRIVGGRHYTTSSMTKTSSITGYLQEGTWTITHDSGKDNTRWGVINWTSSEPNGTSITVRVRSSNDQQNWSIWEDVANGVLLHLTPTGRYLQVETTLTSTIKNISPILYDLTVTPLPEDPVEPVKEADLVASITTDNYIPQINDTIKIILNVGNNGPDNASNVNVTYKLPFGIEYMSSNGNYDHITGLWTVGNLESGLTATLEILAKILNHGSLVNIETVTGLEYDPNTFNNQAELTLNIPHVDPDNQIPEVPSNLPDNGMETMPPIPNIEDLIDLDIYQPGTNPNPPNNPPNTPGPNTPPNPPGPNPNPKDPNLRPSNTPNTQLARDISGVRAAVSTGNFEENIPNWNLTTDNSDEKVENGEIPAWVYVALASSILIAAILIKKPEWGTAILNGLRTVWAVMRYLGGSTRLFVDKVLIPNLKNIFKITGPEDAFKSFSAILDGLNPNIGSTILKEFLKQVITKLFPNSAPLIDTSIDMIFSGVALAELINDPLGKIENIINILNPYHTDKQDDYESLIDPMPFS